MITVRFDTEADGRWIAELLAFTPTGGVEQKLPAGVIAYGATLEDALLNVMRLCNRVLDERAGITR